MALATRPGSRRSSLRSIILSLQAIRRNRRTPRWRLSYRIVAGLDRRWHQLGRLVRGATGASGPGRRWKVGRRAGRIISRLHGRTRGGQHGLRGLRDFCASLTSCSWVWKQSIFRGARRVFLSSGLRNLPTSTRRPRRWQARCTLEWFSRCLCTAAGSDRKQRPASTPELGIRKDAASGIVYPWHQCSFTRGTVRRKMKRAAVPSAVFHAPCKASSCIL